MPDTGGEYVHISRCFGPYAGFMFGLAQLFIIRTSAAAGLALIVADYLGYFVALDRVARIITALTVIFLFGILNYIGIQRASIFQKLSTILKVGALLSIVFVGAFFSGGHKSLLSTLALFKMRRDHIGGTNIFRVPLYPFLPLLSLLLIMGLIVLRAVFEWQNSLVDLAFIVTGIPFALYWCRRKDRSTRMNARNSAEK